MLQKRIQKLPTSGERDTPYYRTISRRKLLQVVSFAITQNFHYHLANSECYIYGRKCQCFSFRATSRPHLNKLKSFFWFPKVSKAFLKEMSKTGIKIGTQNSQKTTRSNQSPAKTLSKCSHNRSQNDVTKPFVFRNRFLVFQCLNV